jgi:hypothetical protein
MVRKTQQAPHDRDLLYEAPFVVHARHCSCIYVEGPPLLPVRVFTPGRVKDGEHQLTSTILKEAWFLTVLSRPWSDWSTLCWGCKRLPGLIYQERPVELKLVGPPKHVHH